MEKMFGPDVPVVGQALVDFALHGGFPEEEVSSRQVGAEDFGPALEALAAAKAKLETEIKKINDDTAPEVQSWMANAKKLEDDINRSRSMANEIVRRAEAPEVSGQSIQEAEEKMEFLRQESTYNRQVHNALMDIKHVNELLDQAEQARDERRVLDSLRLLEQSWTSMDQLPLSKACRVMRIMNMRAFELKSAAHDVFDRVWTSLINVDVENGQIAIHEAREDEPMSLSEAVVGLKAYKEVNQRMALLWRSIDDAIVKPRTNLDSQTLPGISVSDAILRLEGQTDQSITALFSDLQEVMAFLARRLPEELVASLSTVMMPDLVRRLVTVWLDSAVPASLREIEQFQGVIDAVRTFCNTMRDMRYSGFSELEEWVEGAPRVWLAKCRETALDSVRSKLAEGLGSSKEVERAETQKVSRSEGQELAANGVTDSANNDDWGAAWDDEPEESIPAAAAAEQSDTPMTGTNDDDEADAWGWGEEEATEEKPAEAAEEDDTTDAWGWGDEDAAEQPSKWSTVRPTSSSKKEQTREMTLKEIYHISSMPQPVLALISAILEDGATLAGSENSPVAPAAAGLFSLPTLILAMFRAISPYYYGLDTGGNMFLYNDVTYLSERLNELATSWKARDDIAPRAVTMLRLDNDTKSLQSFAARAYASEMSTQRTVLRDLLGGAQNLIQQNSDPADLTSQIEAATGRVRSMAALWSDILSRSAWCQAVGSLADTLASKVVADVMDLSAIGQDEAYNIANLIEKITELDDLFLPPDAGPGALPATAQYADHWLRLQYLSQVLQSNLPDVKYLWFESDLSLYFTADEVIELIGLSFVDNARTREVVRNIRERPNPRAV